MAQNYLDKNHPGQVAKNITLTSCYNGGGWYSVIVTQDDFKVAQIDLDGNGEKIISYNSLNEQNS